MNFIVAAVTTALIVIGVIVFIVADVVILTKVLRRHRSADDHGEVPVPGEASVTLPAGKVKLSYQEGQHTSAVEDERIQFFAPEDLVVSVVAPDGSELPIDGPGIAGTGSSKSTGIGFSRLEIGSVKVPEAGTYTVRAEAGSAGGLKEPKVLVGA